MTIKKNYDNDIHYKPFNTRRWGGVTVDPQGLDETSPTLQPGGSDGVADAAVYDVEAKVGLEWWSQKNLAVHTTDS